MRAARRGRFSAATSGARGLAALLLLGACASDRVAGGDDFPNSVSTLGRVAAEEHARPDDWNAWKQAPSTPPGVYDSTRVPDSVPEGEAGPALSRRFAEGLLSQPVALAPWLDISGAARAVDTLAPDPSSGARRTVRVQSADGFTSRDTTWSSPGSGGASRVLRMAGRLDFVGGGHRAFVFEDDDGDGVLAPLPGQGNVARVRLEAEDAAGRVEETLLRVSAGVDLDFGKPSDNALLSLRVVTRVGNDTLLSRVLRSVDGLAIYDPSRDSNRVEVEERKRFADGSLEELFYETVVFADSARNYPTRFRSVLTTAEGRMETSLLGRDSLAAFAPGDTGRVRKVFESSVAGDSLRRAETVYRVKLGDEAGRFADNLLLGIERRRAFRFGDRAETYYRLDLEAPVADGRDPVGPGALEMRIDFRPVGWIVFNGEATAFGYVGAWTNHQGRKGSAVFDSLGGYVATR